MKIFRKEVAISIIVVLLGLCFLLGFWKCLGKNNSDKPDINQVEWWKKTNFYHIYVRSFRDTNGDGEGDIRGIIEKLDYIKMLGVETILMSPVYVTPLDDGGYDITNHTDIDPMYGSMKDFDELMAGLKRRNMRIVVDFIINHVSHLHPWFQCSKRALVDPNCAKYKDYFIWNNSTRFEGKYPTNWIGVFDIPMWTWNEERKAFYLHQFRSEQPDLNLENPAVIEELKEIVRFWLRKGASGIRVDAPGHNLEDTEFWRDEGPNPDWDSKTMDPYYRFNHNLTLCYRGSGALVSVFRDVCKNEFDGDRTTINEVYLTDYSKWMDFFGSSPSKRSADMSFQFTLLRVSKPNAHEFRKDISNMYETLRAFNWPNDHGTLNPWYLWVSGNHDEPRRTDWYGEENLDATTWIAFMLPGTPSCYYGDEVGVRASIFSQLPKRSYDTVKNALPDRVTFRSLMPWEPTGPSAGFSNTTDNWNILGPGHEINNVKMQLESYNKNHLKNFISIQRLRKTFIETLVFGDFKMFESRPLDDGRNSSIFTIARLYKHGPSLLFAHNFNNITCEPVHLNEDISKFKLDVEFPREAKVELLNYLATDYDYRKCDKLNQKPLNEDTKVEIDGLILGPSQTVILSF